MIISWRNLFAIILLLTLLLLLTVIPFQLPKGVGEGDFRPYWSSSYLLVHNGDFGDPDQLGYIERELTGWNESFTMYAWFFPTGNLIIAPLTHLQFSHAVFIWLTLSTVVIVVSSILLWPYNKKHPWVPILTTLVFSMTLASLAVGQINTFEVLGLALFLFYEKKDKKFTAGLSLIFVSIKAHLVIITLPLLLLDLYRRKQLHTLAGFFTSTFICALTLFSMYPKWPASFWKLVSFGMVLTRETPTLNGLLVISGNYTWGKWIWVLALIISMLIWFWRGKDMDTRTLIDSTVIIGLIVSPVGWSYDQIMLLLPILRIFEWVYSRSFNKWEAVFVITILIITDSFTFYQRSLGFSDVWFFWVPMMVAAVYVYTRNRSKELTNRFETIQSPN